MKQQDVMDFFDRCAPNWDAELIRNETAIAAILDCGGIRPGIRVLEIKTRYLIQRNAA